MVNGKKKILGVGISGMIGSRIVELLGDKYIFENLSIDTGIDITNPQTLGAIGEDAQADIVCLLAAKADVDSCERDKALGETGDAYRINVSGTQNVVTACKIGKKKLIYISTDFVFDGEHTPQAGYTEEDSPHPINWYAQTKYKGEEIVKNSGLSFMILRLAYPYRKEFALKKDFVRAIAGKLKNTKQQVMAVTDHIMTPTYVDDIAFAFDKLIETESTGIFHVVGSQSISPYDAAVLIAEKFGYGKDMIGKTTRAEYFKDRAPRPFNLRMNNDKIGKLGVKMRTFDEGLEEMI